MYFHHRDLVSTSAPFGDTVFAAAASGTSCFARSVVGQSVLRHQDNVNVGMMSVKGRSSSAKPNALFFEHLRREIQPDAEKLSVALESFSGAGAGGFHQSAPENLAAAQNMRPRLQN